MDLKINVITGEQCAFVIKDVTGISPTGYLSESNDEFIPNSFKYSDTVSIILLTLIKIDNIVEKDPIFIIHDHYDYDYIQIDEDGHYELNYIVIPTKEWFDNNKDKYSIIYFSDGKLVFKYDNNEICLIDPRDLILDQIQSPSISRICEDYMSIYLLKRCFINICKEIFNLKVFSKCAYIGSSDSQLIYNRDLLWMIINTISYLLEFGLIDEAQRILELTHNCNGICKSGNRTTNSNGCGCA